MNLNVRRLQEIHGILVCTVGYVVYQTSDASIDQCLGAIDAGKMCNVAGSTLRRNPMQGALNDRVRLGMDGAYTMSVHH